MNRFGHDRLIPGAAIVAGIKYKQKSGLVDINYVLYLH